MTICNACGLEYAQNHHNQKYCQPCKPLVKAANARKRNLDISRQKAARRACKIELELLKKRRSHITLTKNSTFAQFSLVDFLDERIKKLEKQLDAAGEYIPKNKPSK